MENYGKHENERNVCWWDIIPWPVLPYLIHFVPLRVQIFFDDLAFEMAVAHSECGVGVRFAFHQAQHICVHCQQVPGLQQVDPHHTLRSTRGEMQTDNSLT